MDKRKISSPINGQKGGRPRIWNVNPYLAIRELKSGNYFDADNQIKMLRESIANHRKQKQKKELSRIHKRTDLAMKQIEYQKQLRTRKLAELRHLRSVVRKLLASLESIDSKDLDYKRNPKAQENYDEDVF